MVWCKRLGEGKHAGVNSACRWEAGRLAVSTRLGVTWLGLNKLHL